MPKGGHYSFSHLVPVKERKEVIERAKKRAEKNVEVKHTLKLVQETLRKEVDARRCIQDLVAIRKTLIQGYEPNNHPEEQGDVWLPLDMARITALRAAAEVSSKLLNKVLPDLKSVEIQGDQDESGKYIFNVNTGIIRQVDDSSTV